MQRGDGGTVDLGKGRRRAHISRFVRIHVGVGQRCRAIDGDSPALQAKKRNALRSIGAMDEMTNRRVQNARTHILRRKSHEHAHSDHLVQGGASGSIGALDESSRKD